MESLFTNFNFTKLEFDKILFQISKYTLSSEGNSEILNTVPLTDFNRIRYLHKLVSSLKIFFIEEENLEINVIFNFNKQLSDAEKEITVQAVELYKLAYSVRTYFYISKRFKKPKFVPLADLFSIEKLKNNFYQDILNYIDENGFVDSKASSELRKIRNDIRTVEEKIKNATESFFKETKSLNYTVDDIISVRDGLNCIAIKSNYKNKVEGIILDTSGTGQTVFVVPKKVIELNNDLFILKEDEKKEIQKILFSYTEEIVLNQTELEIIDQELLFFDGIYAKSKYSHENNHNSPEITDNKIIKLFFARHPLLGKNAVPLEISIGNDYNLLVITGPNTGGKTVVLKTIGLFVLMVQSGIPIPASGNSQFTVFNKIFLDIGDDQSIENSLSTFSGHLIKLIDLLNKADDFSLILLDELCGGTDPEEGSALALSIIQRILELKSLGIITTHYSAIKHFATDNVGIENASMEFDNEKLAPTYKLHIGLPGSSKAFEISRRLGMPESVVNNALSKINSEFINIERIKERLEAERKKIDSEKNEFEKEKNKLQKDIFHFEEKLKILNQNEEKVNELLAFKKDDFLKEARQDFERIIKDIKTEKASKETILEGKEFFKKIESDISEIKKSKEAPKKNIVQNFQKGDRVKIISKNIKGTILEKTNKKNEYLVQAGIIKLNIKSDDLEKMEVQKKEYIKESNYQLPEIKAERTLDLRGSRYEEAENKLDKFIGEALVNGITSVRIVHGLGTGALRKCIQEYFDNSPFIKRYEFEKGANEASTNFGVTVAELRKR